MSLPLEGYRVADFGWVAAAPIIGGLLADMGAEVIKIESRARWDTSRFTPDNTERNPDKDPWFHCINRGKLSITLNLSKPEAIELSKRLIEKSDVVIENFSPGIMRRYGMDYESLRKLKSDIIMISLSGCGQDGPYSHLVAYGPSLNGLAGLDSMVGYESERVLGMQQAFSDFNGPIHGVFAVLAALYHREKTGEGSYIDLAQVEALVSVIGEGIMEYTMNGRVTGTMGNSHPTMVPHNNYRCKGDDKWISIAIKTAEEWQALCQALDNPEWCNDEKFADPYKRFKNRDELDNLITKWTEQHDPNEAMQIMQAKGVAAIPCMDIEDRYLDTHFSERETFVFVNDSDGDPFVVTNTPFKMSRTQTAVQQAAPKMGEHNNYVFGDILGLDYKEISRLEEDKIIY